MVVFIELLKAILLSIITVFIIVFGSLNFFETKESKIFSILITILLVLVYLTLLKNDLDQLKNEYDHDVNECDKKWKKEVADTQVDLEKRGMTTSGEAIKKLGKLSAYKEVPPGGSPTEPLEVVYGGIPRGEVNQNYDDYKKHRSKKFKLDFARAKYLVIINLFKN